MNSFCNLPSSSFSKPSQNHVEEVLISLPPSLYAIRLTRLKGTIFSSTEGILVRPPISECQMNVSPLTYLTSDCLWGSETLNITANTISDSILPLITVHFSSSRACTSAPSICLEGAGERASFAVRGSEAGPWGGSSILGGYGTWSPAWQGQAVSFCSQEDLSLSSQISSSWALILQSSLSDPDFDTGLPHMLHSFLGSSCHIISTFEVNFVYRCRIWRTFFKLPQRLSGF